MEKTIKYIDICNFWDNKVVIKEIEKYSDTRGMVSEIFRIDSDITFDAKMCYISETNSYIMRGPHQHVSQKDAFITWGESDTRMVYHLYNIETKELKYFITEPNKIYIVIVEPGIIHSYRNISNIPIKTLNFPNQLFKGENKKENIDEIRYEDKVSPQKSIYILGAGGRLGSSLTKKLFDNMGLHTYNVIPIFDKYENNKQSISKLHNVLNFILLNKKENDVIINCIAKTNVQDETCDFMFSNFQIPKFLSEFAVQNKIYLINFSTDYVFQTGNISKYTKSKQSYESWVGNVLLDDAMMGFMLSDINKYLKIIRLSNLFSLNKKDEHNLINKIYTKIKEGKINVTKDLLIMPTSVDDVSDFILKYIENIDSYPQYIGVSGKKYLFEEFKSKYFNDMEYTLNTITNPSVINNSKLFFSNNYYELNCDKDIQLKINLIKE